MSFILMKTSIHSLCLWNTSRVYKQGRKKMGLKHREAFLPSEDDPFSFSHPQVHLWFNKLWGYLFKVCFCCFLKFHSFNAWFILCVVHCALKYIISLFPALFLLTVSTKTRLHMVYLPWEEGVFCSGFTACITVELSLNWYFVSHSSLSKSWSQHEPCQSSGIFLLFLEMKLKKWKVKSLDFI